MVGVGNVNRGETYTSCLRFMIYDYVIIHFRRRKRAAMVPGSGLGGPAKSLVKHDYYNRSPSENVVVKALEVTTSAAHPPLRVHRLRGRTIRLLL